MEVYVQALRLLKVDNKDAGDVWNEVKDSWVGGDDSLYEVMDSGPLKDTLVQEAVDQLTQPYGDFVALVNQINSGRFDQGGEEDEEEEADQLEELLEEIAVKLDKKNDHDIDELIEYLADEVGAGKDQLKMEATKLKNVDAQDKKAIRELRRSSTIDLNDFNKLLQELESDEVETEEDEVRRPAQRAGRGHRGQAQAADPSAHRPRRARGHGDGAGQAVRRLGRVQQLGEEQVQHQEVAAQLVHRRERPQETSRRSRGRDQLDPVWNDKIDRLIDELAEEMPGGRSTKTCSST